MHSFAEVMHNSANGGLCDAKRVGQGAVTRPRSFITYIIISVAVSVGLLRLMGDVLVSFHFHSDSSATEKLILYLFFQSKKYHVWRVSVRTC